ncbi:myosin-G heavy chain protein [Trifolium repens]|nr:myosin-G heavy chain protein [Trifolium repens]
MKQNSMATINLTTTSSLHPNTSFVTKKHNSNNLIKFNYASSLTKTCAQSQGTEAGVSEDDSSLGSLSSSRAQLDLLEQFTSTSSSINGYESDGTSRKLSIRDQLAQLVGERDDDFSIPLGKNLKKVSAKFLTTSQRRNIKRQNYLNEVTQRNDSTFFATIGAFVLLPPLIILGIAILTGYVQLLP